MNNYLPSDYQNFIHKSRYARWLPDEQRREEWPETVGRYFDYMEHYLLHFGYDMIDDRAELDLSLIHI